MNPNKWWRSIGLTVALLALSAPLLARAWRQDQAPANPSAQPTAQADSETDKTPQKAHRESGKEKKADDAKKSREFAAAAAVPQVLTVDAGDIASLDVAGGIGGKKDAPDPNAVYTFISEDLSQTQPKFDVRDPQGRRWRVKMGPEAQPETAASKLVYAVGFFTDENYYLDSIHVKNLPRLKRGQKYVKNGVPQGVRLKLMPKGQKNIGNWTWQRNPFSGTSDLNRLRTVMALLNNWDLNDRNNKIYLQDGQRRYVVADLGAAFGRAGNEITRRKGDVDAYQNSDFIVKTTATTVDFSNHSRPLPATVIANTGLGGVPHYYTDLVQGEKVVKDIPIEDARQVGQRLSQLSDQQLRDCFVAAGYLPEEVDGFTKVLHERIAALAALPVASSESSSGVRLTAIVVFPVFH